MANIGNDFFRHLMNKKKPQKDDLITKKYQNNTYITTNLKDELVSKVDIEKKNKEYKLKGKKTKKIELSKIEIRKQENLVEIEKNNNIVVRAKLEEEVLKKLENDIKNNRKFEIKIEDINEKKIKAELTKVIEKDKNEVKKINDEVEKVEQETNKNQKNDYVNEVEEKLKKIQERLSIINTHYEIISEYYDFKGYSNLKNTLLINSIEDYSFYKTSNEVDELVVKCKEESKKLNIIIEATDKCIKADKKILEVKKYTEKRDKEYLENKEKIDLIDKGYEKISANIKEENTFLEKLDDDISYLENKLNENKLFNNSKPLLDNILKISICTKLMPIFPSFRLLFQALILKNITETTKKLFIPDMKKEIITKDIVRKYINMIYNNKSNMDLIIKNLSESITNIKEIKEEFISKFEKHKDIFDDYNKYLNKINQTLKNLEEKNKKINEYKKQLNKKEEKILKLKG